MTSGGPVWAGEIRFQRRVAHAIFAWRGARKSVDRAHADIFHPAVPDVWIDRGFAIMVVGSQHAFRRCAEGSRDTVRMQRCDKKTAGRRLGGRESNDYRATKEARRTTRTRSATAGTETDSQFGPPVANRYS